MTPIDLGALVVIAARVLDEDVAAVLDLMDVAAAEAALASAAAEAALAQAELTQVGLAAEEDAGSGPAAHAAALLSGLIGHRPLARGNEQVAVLATVTFLAVNGWQVELEPAEDTMAVVTGLAAGEWSAAGLAAWLSPRISACRTAGHPVPAGQAGDPALTGQAGDPALTAQEIPATTAKEAPMTGWLPNLRRTPRRRGDLMFHRFSPRAREVIISAQQEARALHHNFIGTEHLLLGLVRDRDGVSGRALHMLGISPETVREQILDIVGEGNHEPSGHIPITPRGKRVLRLAVREAVQLGHLYVGTEHILLGLVREGDGVGWHVLSRLGVTVPKARDQVLELVRQDQRASHPAIEPPGIRDYDTRIELARQAKDAAVDAKDLDRAAAARESEKELLAERERLIARWSAGVDVATLGLELDWLRGEVNRLQRLLLENGIEPDQPAQRPERDTA